MHYYFCLYNKASLEIKYPWDAVFDLETEDGMAYFKLRAEGYNLQSQMEPKGPWVIYIEKDVPFSWDLLEGGGE